MGEGVGVWWVVIVKAVRRRARPHEAGFTAGSAPHDQHGPVRAVIGNADLSLVASAHQRHDRAVYALQQ
jgi:hypothetical protein